jgi:hypothetical protein
MKIITSVKQSEVISHWEKIEKISIFQRIDIVFPLVAYNDLLWNLAEIESIDSDSLYICSSNDWSVDGLCVPDFKVSTSIEK